MKSKDLIKILQQIDPTGDTDIVVNNMDIYEIRLLTANQLGWMQKLVGDREINTGTMHYIRGAEYTGTGRKIYITPMSIYEAFHTNPDMEVKIIGADSGGIRRSIVDSWRQDTKAPKKLNKTPRAGPIDEVAYEATNQWANLTLRDDVMFTVANTAIPHRVDPRDGFPEPTVEANE